MKTIITILTYISSLFLLTACAKNDNFAIPKLECIEPQLIETITYAELYKLASIHPQKYTKTDIISGYTVSSDRENHFYNTLYLVSPNNNFAIKILAEHTGLGYYTSYPIGRKVFIHLQNLYLQEKEGILQLGEIYEENLGSIARSVVKSHLIPSCSDVTEQQLLVNISIAQAISSDHYVGKLIEINEVQFIDDAVGKPYNDIDASGTSKSLVDTQANTLIVRTNRQALYATNLVPKQSGRIRGVLTKFGANFQLVVRFESDIQLTQPRFDINTNEKNPHR